MYRSCLLIDVGNNPDRPRPGRLWLRNRYHVHQRLCMAFPSASRKAEDVDFLTPFKPDEFGNGQVHVKRAMDSGFLFRIDPLPNSRAAIIVQSAVKPDWEYAFHNAGHILAAPPEVKPFEPRFSKGQYLRFRLVANPTRKIDTRSGPDGIRRHGRRVPVPTDELIDWLARRGDTGGFSICKDSATVEAGYIYVNKTRDGNGQRLRSARYEGIIEVIDPGNFRNMHICGIGSGKAFGFGLFSVSQVPSEA